MRCTLYSDRKPISENIFHFELMYYYTASEHEITYCVMEIGEFGEASSCIYALFFFFFSST